MQLERFLDIFPFLQFFLHLQGEFISLIIASHVWSLKALTTQFKKTMSAYLINFLNKRKEILSFSSLSSHTHYACLIYFSVSLEKRKKLAFSALNVKRIPVGFYNCRLSGLYKKGSSWSYLSEFGQVVISPFVCFFQGGTVLHCSNIRNKRKNSIGNMYYYIIVSIRQ